MSDGYLIYDSNYMDNGNLLADPELVIYFIWKKYWGNKKSILNIDIKEIREDYIVTSARLKKKRKELEKLANKKSDDFEVAVGRKICEDYENRKEADKILLILFEYQSHLKDKGVWKDIAPNIEKFDKKIEKKYKELDNTRLDFKSVRMVMEKKFS
ncbi:MAG: hypothetical protein ACP5UL_05195 [Thermoplasmata archaeon]